MKAFSSVYVSDSSKGDHCARFLSVALGFFLWNKLLYLYTQINKSKLKLTIII